MVFDWFNRRPEAAQPAQPASSPEDTAASSLEEESVASAPSAASEGPPTESVASFSAPAATEPVPDPEPPQPSAQQTSPSPPSPLTLYVAFQKINSITKSIHLIHIKAKI